jgi:hypothetical protein
MAGPFFICSVKLFTARLHSGHRLLAGLIFGAGCLVAPGVANTNPDSDSHRVGETEFPERLLRLAVYVPEMAQEVTTTADR